jgi:SAM-dependent methyltransferase
MLSKDILGMKFPDEFVIRFFFKTDLHKITGKVLELGCGSGNNLRLFYEYGWDVKGVDCTQSAIDQAENNLFSIKKEYDLEGNYEVEFDDMLEYLKKDKSQYDVIIFPSSIFYLSFENIKKVLSTISQNALLKKGGYLFLKVLTPDDYRYGKGEQLDDKSFLINIEETGEKGALITFLNETEWITLLSDNFQFTELILLPLQYMNIQDNTRIFNSNIIIWGKI